MIKWLFALLLCGMLSTRHAAANEMAHGSGAAQNTITATAALDAPLVPGQAVRGLLRLNFTATNQPVHLSELSVAHTKKIHLLLIDPTLTDYHHLHPEPTALPGVYSFSFTPQKTSYRLWADIKPRRSGKQEYATTDIGSRDPRLSADRTLSTTSTVNGYTFTLTLNEPLTVTSGALATISVTDTAGVPVTTLEPVLGAFAHVVGFSEDYQSVAHMHPLGAEPKNAAARGSSPLEVHMMPAAAGFMKVYAQVRLNGSDIFAPFGVMVQP